MKREETSLSNRISDYFELHKDQYQLDFVDVVN